ncbi:c-type cytochrome [Ramlibacter sp. PS4R-6]|uniref:c-type cytochrome n=1 Tax=Ramlibacter sp. PS4R-6 TaxID=3133438 RepID=UPI0030A9D774
MKPFALVLAALIAVPASLSFAAGSAPQPAAAAPAAAKPDLNAGSTKYGAVCAACHGADGNSGVPANPKLAQQHPEYIVKQLAEFKSGKRPSPIMQPMAAQLSDADMRNIAYWAGSQKAKTGFAKDKELVTLGEKIYRGGILEKQVAACAGCHSPNGAGIPAQFPRLSGQHADYTYAQLVSFQTGARKNSPQMVDIATRLSEREMKAVADYIAGLR